MPNPVVKRLLKETKNEEVFKALNDLSLSELNSMLLEIFRAKATHRPVHELLQSYRQNRFVIPSKVDPVELMKMEIQLLQLANHRGFQVMELSPLAPLGSCSAFALADQNKIVSALRGTEAVADATNVLAIDSAIRRINSGFDKNILHTCAAHRHVRAQTFSGKGFSAHFKIFCAVSAGKDTGNFSFERETLLKHLSFYNDFLVNTLKLQEVKIIIKDLQQKGIENRLAKKVYEEVKPLLQHECVTLGYAEAPHEEHKYYKHLRFSINVLCNGREFNLGDGGFVDWPEKLTNNKKERMLTSGLGTELLFKLMSDLL